MGESKDYIQLPPLRKDSPTELVEIIWEYLKLPKDSRVKIVSMLEDIQDRAGKTDFQIPKLYEIVPKEEIAEFERTMQKIISEIISEASSIACWVYVEKYIQKKTLAEMLMERKNVNEYIFAIDALFENLMGPVIDYDRI